MVGLVSVGAYVPRYRLTGALLREAWGGAGDGERALANHDEDSLTMACEAALAALTGRDVSRVGACFLASTSAPYAEKSTARSEEHTSELQSIAYLVCRLLL